MLLDEALQCLESNKIKQIKDKIFQIKMETHI